MKLVQEAAVDEQFLLYLKRVQGALDQLESTVERMNGEGSMTRVTATQKASLRQAASQIARILEKAQ